MDPAAERGFAFGRTCLTASCSWLKRRKLACASTDTSAIEPLDRKYAYIIYLCEEGTLMGAKSHISKWGTSLAVRIPKPIAEQWGVQEGSAIEIVSRGDQVVLRKKSYNPGRHAGQCDARQSPF